MNEQLELVENDKIQMSISIKQGVRNLLEILAQKQNRSMSNMIEYLIQMEFANMQIQEAKSGNSY